MDVQVSEQDLARARAADIACGGRLRRSASRHVRGGAALGGRLRVRRVVRAEVAAARHEEHCRESQREHDQENERDSERLHGWRSLAERALWARFVRRPTHLGSAS